MIRNCFFQLIKFQRITPKFYRYSQINKKNNTSQSQLILKDQDFDKIVEYWDQQVSKPKPNSVSIEKVLNKISLAEHLLGSELQDKNWEFFEDMFDKNFLERLYIPSQYPQKIQIILNLSMELSLLEYQYRLNRKEFQQLEQVLERIRGILENIYNFESKISDLGEAEFNNLLRQSQLFDMKAFYQKTLNPDGYLEFLEESTKCLDQAVKIVNDIIKHKENVEQIKYQIGKTQAMSKIARNFEMLAEFLLISGQEEEARPFLEKALEIYNTFTDGITPKHVLCRCRIARANVKDNYELAVQKIDELFEDIQQYGETDILFVIKMYRFVILSQKEIVETEYEEVFEMMKKYRVTDPFIMSEVLYYSIKYTYEQGYSQALNEHLHQALVLLETSVGKINLEQLLHLVAKVSVDLPRDIKDQNQILKIVYENFEKLKQQIDDSYFSDHLFYQSLIKAKLLFNDKKQPEIIVQPFISFIEQIKEKGQTNINHYLKLITKFLEKNGITVTQKQLEDLSQKIQIK